MSDGPMDRQLISILASNREDSYATQRKREYILSSAVRALRQKFGLQKLENLKAKHVQHLVELWKAQDSGRRSIDERMTHLRWLVRKIGKANLLPRTNAELGIEPGPRHTRAGRVVSDEDFARMLERVDDSRIRLMLLLGRHLGLRFKEASLFRPWQDWQGDRVWVKRGTKGGRPRYLWVHDPKQVEVLRETRQSVRNGDGIIPPEYRTYEQWRQHVYRILRRAGIGRGSDVLFHDLRRTYLVERMKELIGRAVISPERAAALVAREAGHNRTEVLAWYLGAADVQPGMGSLCCGIHLSGV